MSRSSSPMTKTRASTPAAGAGLISTNPVDNLDSKLEDLKKRLHLLQGDRKAYLESSAWSLSQAKDRIKSLRHDNQALYKRSADLQSIVRAHMEGNNDAEKMAYQLRELRKKYDEIKHKADEKAQQVSKFKDTMRELEMETPTEDGGEGRGEGRGDGGGGTSQLQSKARQLELKIEKAALKHTEALSVKRTYEQILDHLQEDRVGYDSHVDSLEQGVQSKDKELMELTALYQDAIRSKELAKEELMKCEYQANEEKKRRDQFTEEKKQRIKQLMEGNARMERKMKREEQRLNEMRQKAKPTTPTPEKDPEYFIQRLNTLSNAYQTVSTLAGVGSHFNDLPLVDLESDGLDPYQDVLVSNTSPDYNTISQYIAAQSATARTLETHQAKASARLEALRAERASLAETVSTLRLRQLVPPGTRKQVDSYEGRLAQTNATYVRARSKYERAAKANSAILAGVSSLASKLQFVEPEEEFPAVTDQNLGDVIQLCKRKIDYIVSATKASANDLATSPSGSFTPFPPQFTIRVKQGNLSQVPDQILDESQVPTRAAVKGHSASIVERELKKSKRKKKHSSSSDKRTPPPTSRGYSPSSTARNRDSVPSSARHK